MLALLILEAIVGGTLLVLFVYFYNEIKWQRWSEARFSKVDLDRKKQKVLPDPSSYKTDGVVY